MILPFNFKKIAPPRPQGNQMRPLQLGNTPWNTSNLILTQPTHSGTKLKRTVLPK